MGEVGLHGARRDEQTRGDVSIGQSFADQPYDITFGRRVRLPPAGGPLGFTAAPLGVGDRLLLRPKPTNSAGRAARLLSAARWMTRLPGGNLMRSAWLSAEGWEYGIA